MALVNSTSLHTPHHQYHNRTTATSQAMIAAAVPGGSPQQHSPTDSDDSMRTLSSSEDSAANHQNVMTAQSHDVTTANKIAHLMRAAQRSSGEGSTTARDQIDPNTLLTALNGNNLTQPIVSMVSMTKSTTTTAVSMASGDMIPHTTTATNVSSKSNCKKVVCQHCCAAMNQDLYENHLRLAHAVVAAAPETIDVGLIDSIASAPATVTNGQAPSSYICDQCKIHFDTESALQFHILQLHVWNAEAVTSGQGNNTATCVFCNERFASLGELDSHIKMSHLNDSTAVDTLMRLGNGGLSGAFNGSLELEDGELPRRSVNGKFDPKQPFNVESWCEICQREFCNKYFLRTHKYNKHNIGEPIVRRPYGSNRGDRDGQRSMNGRTSAASSDMESATEVDANKFPINDVPLNLSNGNVDHGANSKTHTTSPSSTNQEIVTPKAHNLSTTNCPFCGVSFSNSFQLQTHFVTAHSSVANMAAISNMQQAQAMYTSMMLGAAGAPNYSMMQAAMMGMVPPNLAAMTMPPPVTSEATAASGYLEHALGMLPGALGFPYGIPPQVAPEEYTAALNGIKEEAVMEKSANIDDKLSDQHPNDQNTSRRSSDSSGTAETENGISAEATEGEERVHCGICQKYFCNKLFLVNHQWKRHGIVPQMHDGALGIGFTPTSSLNGTPVQPDVDVKEPIKRPISQSEEPPVPIKLIKLEDISQAVFHQNQKSTLDGILHQRLQQMTESSPSKTGNISVNRSSKYRTSGPIPANVPMNEQGVPNNVDPDAYCELCRKEFCSKYFLKTHKQNIHGVTTPDPPVSQGVKAEDGSDRSGQNGGTDSSISPTGASGTSQFSPCGKKNFCDLCNKEVCNKYFLRTHMARMHGLRIDENKVIIGTVTESTRSGYKCDICNKELSSRHFLQVHRVNQHGLKDDFTPPTSGPNDLTGMTSGTNLAAFMSSLGASAAPNATLSGSGGVGSNGDHSALQPNNPNDLENTTYYNQFMEVCSQCNRRYKSSKCLRNHMLNDHGISLDNDTSYFENGSSIFSGQSGPLTTDQLAAQMNAISQKSAHSMMTSSKTSSSDDGAEDVAAALSTCEFCGEIFSDHGRLQQHVISKHQKELAAQVLAIGVDHAKRMNIMKAESVAEEAEISVDYNTEDSMDSNHPNPVINLIPSCDYCKAQFTDILQLQMHVIYHHQNELKEKAVMSDETASPFVSEDMDHMDQDVDVTTDESVIPPGPLDVADQKLAEPKKPDRWHQCSFCSYGTKHLSNLCSHEKRHREKLAESIDDVTTATSNEKTLTCRYCWRQYRYLSTLERHVNSVHRFLHTQYKALGNLTAMKCAQMIDQNSHALPMGYKTPYSSPVKKSPICTTAFNFGTESPRKNLTRFLLANTVQQLKSPPRRLNICKFCTKQFGSKELCRLHEFTIHNDETTSIVPPVDPIIASSAVKKVNYRCRICTFQIDNIPSLRQHLRNEHQHELQTIRKTPSKSSPCRIANRKRSEDEENEVVLSSTKSGYRMQQFMMQPLEQNLLNIFGQGLIIQLPVKEEVARDFTGQFKLSPLQCTGSSDIL